MKHARISNILLRQFIQGNPSTEINSLGPNLWISRLGIQICICWSQIQKVGTWIRKPVSIWCDHHYHHAARHFVCIELIKVFIVDCGTLSHSSSMAVQLLDIGGNWITLSSTLMQCIPNMLNGWHDWPWKNWEIFRTKELCTDPYDMGPCIIMLKHEIMVEDELRDNGPQDLVTASLHSNCHR